MIPHRRPGPWPALLLAGCVLTFAQLSAQQIGDATPLQSPVERAAAAENAGRYAEAAELYLQLTTAEPDRAEWLVHAGRCLGRAGRFNDAIDLLSRRRNAFPGVLDVPAMLARTLLLKVETSSGVLNPEVFYADAIALCEEILQVNPRHEEALLILAQAHYGAGNPEEAEAAAGRAVAALPDHSGARILVGRIAFDSFRWKKRLLETRPEDGGVAHTEEEKARLVATIDVDRNKARAAFRKAAELDPDRAFAHIALGDLAAWDKETGDALRHWGDALAVDPYARIGHAWLAQNTTAAERQRMFTAAAQQYSQRPDADPKSAALLDWHAARCLYDQGEWQLARQAFATTLVQNDALTNSHYYMGVCAWRLADEDAAERSFAAYSVVSATGFADILRELDPKSRAEMSQLIRYLADRSYKQNRKDNSRDLNQVIAALENSADAWNNYAFLCRETGRFEDALAGYQHALEKEPESPQLWNDAAVILHYHMRSAENVERARSMYRRALELAAEVLKNAEATDLQKQRAQQAQSDARLNLGELDG